VGDAGSRCDDIGETGSQTAQEAKVRATESNKNSSTRKLYDPMFYRTGIIANGSFTLWKEELSTILAGVALNLSR